LNYFHEGLRRFLVFLIVMVPQPRIAAQCNILF
jgi:hypothetical protein